MRTNKLSAKLLFIKRTVLVLAMAVLMISATVLADQSPVGIKFAYSYNGKPVIAQTDVSIPWFDLGSYDLEEFNRYDADPFEMGGGYNSNRVVQTPTVLHSLIRMHEWAADNGINDLTCEGSATSMFITQLFGNNTYNLMYYVNHQYPLMAPGWGSTADYILLEDNMTVDFAIFDNWDFWYDGAFMYFDQDDYYLSPNTTETFTVYGTPTYAVMDGSTAPAVVESGVKVALYDVSGNSYDNFEPIWEANNTTAVDGTITLNFANMGINFQSGDEYVLVALDEEAGTEDANKAPGFAKIHFVANQATLTDVALNVPANQTLHAQETYQLNPVITESTANVDITYTSSNPAVASVGPSGLVTAQTVTAPSDVTITCTATQGSVTKTATATFRVLVGTPASNVTLDHHYMEIPYPALNASGNQITGTLTATVAPENASYTVINWTPWSAGSSNVALVGTSSQSNVGIVHPQGVGVQVVRATSQSNPQAYDECRVAVGGKFGDVDGNGIVDYRDVRMASSMMAEGTTDSDTFAFIDFDDDNRITRNDVAIITAIFNQSIIPYVAAD